MFSLTPVNVQRCRSSAMSTTSALEEKGMTSREKYEKHLQFWSTRPFPKRKGKTAGRMLIEAMDRAIAEIDPQWLVKIQAVQSKA